MTNEPFVPTQTRGVFKRLLDASKRNQSRDEIDAKNGSPAEHLLPISMQARTIISALTAALEARERYDSGHGWDCVAEGLEMLIRLEVPLRQLDAMTKIVDKK